MYNKLFDVPVPRIVSAEEYFSLRTYDPYRQKIGLIDVDGHNYPNLPLMKISAYHKSKGDNVEFLNRLKHYDKVYVSKVFGDEYTEIDNTVIDADEIIYGGTGFAITIEDGKEVYHKDRDKDLPYEIEHMYPDYALYPELTKDTAYGFLTRGCPRACDFCIVAEKEGRRSIKVADLSEWWRGQKNVVLLDPNILACRDHVQLLQQLAESGACVDFTQGLDIRLTNERNVAILNEIKVKEVHFAWDRPEDDLRAFFERYKGIAKHKPHGRYGTVYCLVNNGSTIEQDLYRIYTLRDMGYDPYVMVYDKPHAPKVIRDLQRWCNNRFIFRSCERFEDYKKEVKPNG